MMGEDVFHFHDPVLLTREKRGRDADGKGAGPGDKQMERYLVGHCVQNIF
jgi:hypothetical protein